MDNEAMKLLAQFTIRARKIIGAIDINHLARDDDYRNEMFKKTDELADEELLLISLNLREKLGGLMAVNTESVKTEPTQPTAETNKYKFGARG